MTAADSDRQTALMARVGHRALKKMTFQMILLAADPILRRPFFAEGKETPLSIARKVQPHPKSQLQLMVQGFGELPPSTHRTIKNMFEAPNPKILGSEVPLAPVGHRMLRCAAGSLAFACEYLVHSGTATAPLIAFLGQWADCEPEVQRWCKGVSSSENFSCSS